MTAARVFRNAASAMLLVVATVAIGAAAVAQSATSSDEDPLHDLDAFFRTEYALARSATLAATEPIIIVSFDELILLNDGDEKVVGFTPPIYDEVKTFSHLPLAIYVILARYADKPLESDVLGRLAELRAKAVSAKASLAGRAGWDAGLMEVNRQLVAASLDLIDAVAAAKLIGSTQLRDYTRAMRPLVLRNAEVAAKAQIDGLHAAVADFRRSVGEEAWGKTYVVVPVPRQARPGNLQYVYFERLMAGAAGDRLIYAENIFAAEDALNLLGTILLDRRASEFFFDNETRLERDLLADAAAAYLDTLLPASPPAEPK